MDQMLMAIRDTPLVFLPEVSLSLLSLFRKGYDQRCAMEGQPHDWQIDFHLFNGWVRRKFQAEPSAIELAEHVLLSFSPNEQAAFYKYFELLEDFSKLDHREMQLPAALKREFSQMPLTQAIKAMNEDQKYVWSLSDVITERLPIGQQKAERKKNLSEIIRPDPAHKRPDMHLALRTFRGFCAYIMGDERAHQDLQMPADAPRAAFRKFQRWVEIEKNKTISQPWHKVILLARDGQDCDFSEHSAFSLFCDWLDEYAELTGNPNLFR